MSNINKLKKRYNKELNEEDICHRIIIPYLTDILSWSITDIHSEYRVSEYNNKSVDYMIKNNDSTNKFLLEAKSGDTNIKNKRNQIKEYMILSNFNMGLLTNGYNFELFKKINAEVHLDKSFTIEDSELNILKKNNINKKEALDLSEFVKFKYEDEYDSIIEDEYPPYINKNIMKALKIQQITAYKELNPINILIVADYPIATEFSNWLYNNYYNTNHINIQSKKRNIIRYSNQPLLLILDATKPNYTLNSKIIYDEFKQFGINPIKNISEDIPLLTIVSPNGGFWDDFTHIFSQINIENLTEYDLVFSMRDISEEESDKQISKEYIEFKNKEKNNDLDYSISFDNIINCNSISKKSEEILRDFLVKVRMNERDGMIEFLNIYDIKSLYKISYAIATIYGSNKVKEKHAQRAINIVKASLTDIGYDEEEVRRYDVDETEVEQYTLQRERRNLLIQVIKENEEEGDKGAPIDIIIEEMTQIHDFDKKVIKNDLNILARDGKDLYQPVADEYAVM